LAGISVREQFASQFVRNVPRCGLVLTAAVAHSTTVTGAHHREAGVVEYSKLATLLVLLAGEVLGTL